jgi:hypothetical protein
MTEREILALAVDAAAYDAVVVLWVTRLGTQPVLLPRAFGLAAARAGVPFALGAWTTVGAAPAGPSSAISPPTGPQRRRAPRGD